MMIMRYTSRVVGPQYTKNNVGPALPMRQFNFNFINVLHYCLRRLPKNPVKRAKKNFKKCQKQGSKAKNPFTQPILDTTSVQFSTRVNLKFRTRCGVHPNHRIKLFDLKKKKLIMWSRSTVIIRSVLLNWAPQSGVGAGRPHPLMSYLSTWKQAGNMLCLSLFPSISRFI